MKLFREGNANMPNWVQNEIILYGEEKDIKKVLELVKSEESEFDFNKIIPMPKELGIESSSNNEIAIICYLSNKLTIPFEQLDKNYLKYVTNMFDKNWAATLYYERLPNRKEDFDKLYELGKTCCENIRKYKHVDWYNWCIENWGTKWNASEVYVENDVISFQTAWSVPDPILEAFAYICDEHNVTFEGEYADEDRGNNSGHISSEFGITTYGYNSQQALETYVRLWGESECMGKDENGNWINYDCDTCPNKCY